MTIEDFIANMQDLQKENPGVEIIMSKDGEGNQFSPYSGDWTVGLYEPDSTWSGEFSSELEEDEEANAIVLWPIN